MDSITSWRDIADQLTPEQVDQLNGGADLMTAADLLDIARDFAARNLRQMAHADIPAPAGAVQVRNWCPNDDGTAVRDVYGNRWRVGNVIAVIAGEQSSDGAVVWRVELQAADGTLGDVNADQCRELAAVLAVAAAEVDRLDGITPPFS